MQAATHTRHGQTRESAKLHALSRGLSVRLSHGLGICCGARSRCGNPVT